MSAMILGGGGSPNPASELAVQLLFAGSMAFWVWSGPGDSVDKRRLPGALVALGAMVLAVPLAQLVPLPHSVWQGLPQRDLVLPLLEQLENDAGWRALSISPHTTLAALMAIIPAVGIMLGVALLGRHDRRVLVLAIALCALVGAALGALQLTSAEGSFRLYEKSHQGWLTAFHANRNAAVDVLLIGMLGLSTWFALSGEEVGVRRRDLPWLLGGQLILGVAVILTGSRAGIALLVLSLPVHWRLLKPDYLDIQRRWVFAGAGLVVLALAALPFVLSGGGRLFEVMRRFDARSDARLPLWEDTLTAIDGFWPTGSGIGTFPIAFQPFEQFEYLDAGLPNRAHNDYLEFALEAGVFAIPVLLAVAILLYLLARRAWRLSPQDHCLQIFALGTLAIVALHSIVDYPLRNMAIACLAGAAAGLLTVAPRRGSGRVALEGREHSR